MARDSALETKLHSRVYHLRLCNLDEKFSDVTIRIMLVRSAKEDTPNNVSLWNRASGNKMLDDFNTERYTIMYSKYMKLKAPNFGMQLGSETSQLAGRGLHTLFGVCLG